MFSSTTRYDDATSVIDFLQHWDETVFHLINSGFTAPFLDGLLVYLTTFNSSWWIVLLQAAYVLWRRRWDGLIIIFLCVCAIGIADQLASGFFKPLLMRTRPCFELEAVRLLVPQSRSYSFASSHAANTMATTMMLFFLFWKSAPEWRLEYRSFIGVMFGYTMLIGWSRVYVGVHYPLDVLGGFGIGVVAAAGVYLVYSYVMKNWILRHAP